MKRDEDQFDAVLSLIQTRQKKESEIRVLKKGPKPSLPKSGVT